MEGQRADWVLASDDRSVARARSLIAQKLVDLPDESLQVVLLLTSELVTNAVRHGTGSVDLRVAWGHGAVRVEVEDQSPQRPVIRAMDRDALSGRGLVLVDRLCAGWGVLPAAVGKTVWFTAEA